MSNAETVRIRAGACQKLVEQRVNGEITNNDFLERLRESGATSAEAQDYIEQAGSRLNAKNDPPHRSSPAQSEHGSREATPDGLTDEQAAQYRADRAVLLAQNAEQGRDGDQARTAAEQAAAEIDWAILRAKINTLLPQQSASRGQPFSVADLERILGIQLSQPASSTSLSPALLSVAPHMAQFLAGIQADPHIEETCKLRRAFGTDKSLDPIIDVMQLQTLVDPLPRSIWRLIIQDHFVDFEKLYAALGIGYDHQDEPKEFAGGFALIRKEHSSAKRAIKTEAEWTRVFAAWRTGVCFLYPHREVELSGYLKVVTDLFRAVPHHPFARDKYAKSPYHMDNRNDHNLTLLAQMFRPKTTTNVLPRSNLSVESGAAETTQRALRAAQGPRPITSSSAKRTAREAFPEDNDTYMPKFRRGYLWSSFPQNNISPSALYTETAPPLPLPPAHLINDPVFQATLHAMKDHIKKEKPRVITDHKSSGLNDGIPKAEGHVRYDDMHDFGQALHEARVANPTREIVLYKSDVQGAFLNLPAHPLWQLHQVVEVDGILHIVRRLVFVLLLIMWEFVGCPSEDRKQEHGITLKIIGFWVDATLGSISLSPESIADIIAKVDTFISCPDRQPPLRDWQKLAGLLNWALNVLPWARPALTELYRKMKGKVHESLPQPGGY
ncbi:hypothetical protein GGX14DRAFT_537399 [Mycena pura]|uniref:Reverse transcriptase domain-containing protein n=1 Tax=Mycena pura TaxID=153505 RepID=A0AAD6UXY6_9AGAR|nr:hypothetical protein GGX14DRAFT_537399 [Mycena pura]